MVRYPLKIMPLSQTLLNSSNTPLLIKKTFLLPKANRYFVMQINFNQKTRRFLLPKRIVKQKWFRFVFGQDVPFQQLKVIAS